MNTCYGYTRVSTTKQGEGVSLSAQKEAITNYAHQNGLVISQWFEETETAASTGRPVFNNMVKLLGKHQADGVIIHKIDRSARNFRDWAHIGELSDAGVQVHFVTETLDFQSRGGRLAADIQAVIAADYIRNLREETTKGINGRLKQGLYPFKAPVGYLDMGGGKAKVPDPTLAPLVVEAFHLYATGQFSLTALRVEMSVLGLCNLPERKMNTTSLSRMLSNPFYAGTIHIMTTGQEFPGVHQPLISQKLFDRVQSVLAHRSKKTLVRHDHLYRGLFKCGLCGSAMTPEAQKGWVYYRCHKKNCPMKTAREDYISNEVDRVILQLEQDVTLWREVQDLLTKWYVQRPRTADPRSALRLQISNVEQRIRRTTDACVDGHISQGNFEQRMAQLREQQACLTSAFTRTSQHLKPKEQFKLFRETIPHTTELFQSLTKSERREFLGLCTAQRILAPGVIVIKTDSPHAHIERLVYLFGRVFSRATNVVE